MPADRRKPLYPPIGGARPSRDDWSFFESVARLYRLGRYDLLDMQANLFRPLVYLSTSDTHALWTDLAQSIRSGASPGDVDLYLGVPFCRPGCTCCESDCRPASGLPEIARYVKAAWLQARFYAEPLKGLRIRHFYVGGGNPGALSPSQLHALLSVAKDDYLLSEPGDRAVEFDPADAVPEKLEVCRAASVRRIVLKARGDAPSLDEAVRRVRSARFVDGATVELTLGLPGETPATFGQALTAAAEARADRVTVQALQPSQAHLDKHHRGDPRLFHLKNDGLFDSFEETFVPRMTRLGYGLEGSPGGSWRFARKGYGRAADGHYEEHPALPGSVLGLGAAARSHVFALAEYADTARGTEDFGPSKKIFVGTPLDADGEMVRFLLLSLRQGRSVSGAAFAAVFRQDLFAVFHAGLKELERRRLARRDRTGILLTPSRPDDLILAVLALLGKTKVHWQHDRIAWIHGGVGRRRIDAAVPFVKPVPRRGAVMTRADRYFGSTESPEHLADIGLTLGAECNNNCPFCIGGEVVNLPMPHPFPWIPLERAKDEVAHWRRAGCRSLTYLGGEPTLYPHLLELSSYARSIGYRSIIMNSNGLRYSDRKFVLDMVAAGFTRFESGLHSHRDDLEARLTACKDAFRKKIQGLRWLVEQKAAGEIRVGIVVTPVICGWNMPFMRDYARLCRSLGVDTIEYKTVWPRHQMEHDRRMIPRYREYAAEILKVIALNEGGLGMSLEFADVPPCVLKSARLGLPPDVIHALAKKYFALSSCVPLFLSSNGRHYNWQELKANFLKTPGKDCGRCYYYPNCDGVWTPYAALYGLDELTPLAPPDFHPDASAAVLDRSRGLIASKAR
ncbi:MAG: radical SAM protein [Elusimicrobia bacterium]|nr:radical SAM protein [Elusimicrobiota bacterium]